ncbi:MAG: hypothetical protein JXA09_04890 [Anaerolineae bacterium]|nr:hypothetical protein [Anaerolineae bacterium]
MNTFNVGDKIVHPSHGAGVVTEIKEIQFFGANGKRYYSIELVSEPGTVVMVPIRDTEKVGLRHPVPTAQLSRVWHQLRATPQTLPSDHNERYRIVREKLDDGDVMQIAEILRDLWWKDHAIRRLTSEGKRLYDRGMRLLASEVAVVQDSALTDAEAQISDMLDTQANRD